MSELRTYIFEKNIFHKIEIKTFGDEHDATKRLESIVKHPSEWKLIN